MKKYELIKGQRTKHNGVIVYMIKSLKDFADVKAGDIGGYIEKEDNLSHEGNCWVYDDAVVMHSAVVENSAQIRNNAEISDKAIISHDAIIKDNARVTGCAWVYDDAVVRGNALVDDNATVFGHSEIYEDAKIYNRAAVGQRAKVYGNAQIFHSAGIYEHAQVGGDSKVCDSVFLKGDMICTKTPIHFGNSLGLNVIVVDNQILIGCKILTKEEWRKFTEEDAYRICEDKGVEDYRRIRPVLEMLGII